MLVEILVHRVAALLPVVVELTVRQDVDGPLFIGRQPAEHRRALLEWKLPHDVGHVFHEGLHNLRLKPGIGHGLLAGHRHPKDVDVEALLQSAVLTHRAVVVVRRADRYGHGRQVRRRHGRQGALITARVRAAHRPDLAVAPILDAKPLHRVVPVRRLLGEGIPLPFRLEPAANVLDDRHVSAPSEISRVGDLPRRRLVVGRTFHNHRILPLSGTPIQRRKIDVRRKPHSIPHRCHDILPARHVIGNRGSFVGDIHCTALLCLVAVPALDMNAEAAQIIWHVSTVPQDSRIISAYPICWSLADICPL